MTNTAPKLSIVTKRYLDAYNLILEEMIKCMNGIKLSESISQNYIRQMTIMLNTANDISLNILRYTTSLDIQCLALSIISRNTKNIDDLLGLENGCKNRTNSPIQLKPYNRAHNEIMQKVVSEMKSAQAVNNINICYICQIAPLLRGIVRVSENALRFNICVELKPVITAIIACAKEWLAQAEKLLPTLKNHG